MDYCNDRFSKLNFRILDETELYEQQKPFNIEDLTAMAKFGNVFCFRVIWDGILGTCWDACVFLCCMSYPLFIDRKAPTSNALFNAVYHLTMVVYNRDCRRNFIQDSKFWLIKSVTFSLFMRMTDVL
jgi:hypothetical protein